MNPHLPLLFWRCTVVQGGGYPSGAVVIEPMVPEEAFSLADEVTRAKWSGDPVWRATLKLGPGDWVACGYRYQDAVYALHCRLMIELGE